MSGVALLGTASYLPDRLMTAAEIAGLTGIPEPVVMERLGIRAKHIAAPGEHVSDMALRAARTLLDETGFDPAAIDVVMYFGSTYKEYPVWQAAPGIAYQLGAHRAFALELDYVSCGTPVALRVARDMLLAEPDIGSVLAVAASRESYLIDYTSQSSRFMFGFGDGAAAALLTKGDGLGQVLGSQAFSDGSLSMAVKVPVGGSALPHGSDGADSVRSALDVHDPVGMKQRLDATSLTNFLEVAQEALRRSGLSVTDLTHVFPIHMKRSMHDHIVTGLGLDPAKSVYLDDTGHMSGIDPLLALDRAARAGTLHDGDLALLLAAGTGYTWAATVIRWGT